MYFPILYFLKDVEAGAPLHPLLHYEFTSKSFDGYLAKLGRDHEAALNNFDSCPTKTNHVLVDLYDHLVKRFYALKWNMNI